ncbi:MAG: hypothetical protein Q4B48_01140 [Syntrophomonadaceae bacterium]|nr:hypothetical protein [Syntrophomonadaceae bacterium]
MNQPNRPQKNSMALKAAVAVMSLVIVGLTVLLLLPGDTDGSMVDGVKAGRSFSSDNSGFADWPQEDIVAELNRVVEEGMFHISINPYITFAHGFAPGEMRIENISGNHYLMQVQISLDETGEAVYTTDVIEPGRYIESDSLDVLLPAGEYAATATFTALDSETQAPAGTAAAKITLAVKQ